MNKHLLIASCIYIISVTGQLLQELPQRTQFLEPIPRVQNVENNESLQRRENPCNRRNYIPNINSVTPVYIPQFMEPGDATRNILIPQSLKIEKSNVGDVPSETPLKEEGRNFNIKNDLNPLLLNKSISIKRPNTIETSTVAVDQKETLETLKPNVDVICDLEGLVKFLLVDCSNNRRNQERGSNKQNSPDSILMSNTVDLKDTDKKHPIVLKTNNDISDGDYELKDLLTNYKNVEDSKTTSNTLTKSQTIKTKTSNEHKEEFKENVQSQGEGDAHKIGYDISNDSYDIFDDETFWLHNRRLNNEQIEKQLRDPTKGVVITKTSDTKVMLMQTSRVCYACSTANNPACWKPDRTTTVKYCRKENDACVAKTIDTQDSTVLIRDCGNTCDQNNLPGPTESYKSCSICHTDLCNGAFSVNNYNLIFIFFLISLIKYMF